MKVKCSDEVKCSDVESDVKWFLSDFVWKGRREGRCGEAFEDKRTMHIRVTILKFGDTLKVG